MYNTGTLVWDAQNQYLNVTDKVECASFLDGAFAVSLNTPTRFYDGSTWSLSTNVASAPKGKYVRNYQTRLYIANASVDGTLYPSRVYYSDIAALAKTITWDNTNNWFDVETDDGDVITALGKNSNRLLIFKENSLHTWNNYSVVTVSDNVGTSSQRSVVNVRGSTIFLNSDGFWLYDGSNLTLISKAIELFLDGMTATNYASAVAWRKGTHYLCFIGNLSNAPEDISLNNVVVDYDVAANTWVLHALQDTITAATSWKSSSAWGTYLGNSAGKIYQWNVGNTDASTTSAAGVAISFEVESLDYYSGNPNTVKAYQHAFIYTSRGSNMTLQHRVMGRVNTDDDDWVSDGTMRNRVTKVPFDPAKVNGRGIRYKFSECSGGDPVTLEGYSWRFIEGEEQ